MDNENGKRIVWLFYFFFKQVTLSQDGKTELRYIIKFFETELKEL